MNSIIKQFYIRKRSGFFNNITLSNINGIRTLEIIDKEVVMGDMEPRDTIILTFNNNDVFNIDQMRDLANSILKMIDEEIPDKKNNIYESTKK